MPMTSTMRGGAEFAFELERFGDGDHKGRSTNLFSRADGASIMRAEGERELKEDVNRERVVFGEGALR